jgi:hypothetical protein
VQRRETAPAYPPEHGNGAGGTDGRADAAAGGEGAARAQPSAHDAPLSTAASDPNSSGGAAVPSGQPSSRPSARRSTRPSADRKGD